MNHSDAEYEPLPGSAPNVRSNRPVFDISFNDYIATTNGLFNFLEIVGGVTLSVLLGSDSTRYSDSKARRLLSGTAYTFCFNGIFMMVSSLLSSVSAAYLPVLFYYVLFQAMGAACYIISGIMIARQTHEVSVVVVVGLCSGGMHAFHFAYCCYKNYIEEDEKKWQAMSVSSSLFPVKERNPRLGRCHVPRFVLDEDGHEVMEDLRTDDLPPGPPDDANFARKRLLIASCSVLLLAGVVAFIVCAIVESPSAFFGHLSAAGSDHTTHEAGTSKESGSSSKTTRSDNVNASSYPAVDHTLTDALFENVSASILAEDADANTLLTSIEAVEVPATDGSKLSRNSL